MEEWLNFRRRMVDSDPDWYAKGVIADAMFLHLKNSKLKGPEWTKFKQRDGVIFKKWVAKLHLDYDVDLVNSLVSDDDFWTKTLEAI